MPPAAAPVLERLSSAALPSPAPLAAAATAEEEEEEDENIILAGRGDKKEGKGPRPTAAVLLAELLAEAEELGTRLLYVSISCCVC